MITALHNDGVVCLCNSFDQSWLDLIEQGIESALGGASTDVDIVKRDGDAGSFSFSSGAWQTVAPFHRFIFDSHLADIAWSLLDTTELVLFYDFLLVKQARSDSAGTPWHQDHSYYPLDGHKAINCWVALDDIPMSSALRFVRGSPSREADLVVGESGEGELILAGPKYSEPLQEHLKELTNPVHLATALSRMISNMG